MASEQDRQELIDKVSALANAQFGPSQLIPIMLEGPKGQLDRQGPALVRSLASR